MQSQRIEKQADPHVVFQAQFGLSDTKIIRSRTVYDVITFVSEVSGFADIFFVVFTHVFALLYTPFLLEAQLHRHMGSCVTLKKKREAFVSATDTKGVAEILNEIVDRFTLKLSIWVIIASKYLPTRYRS